MNKRIVIILVAVLVVLLAAILVIELVKPENKGPDTLIVNSNGETGVIVDLETGSIVEDASQYQDVTSNDKIMGNETVGEKDMDDADSSDKNETSSDPEQQTMEGFKPWQ